MASEQFELESFFKKFMGLRQHGRNATLHIESRSDRSAIVNLQLEIAAPEHDPDGDSDPPARVPGGDAPAEDSCGDQSATQQEHHSGDQYAEPRGGGGRNGRKRGVRSRERRRIRRETARMRMEAEQAIHDLEHVEETTEEVEVDVTTEEVDENTEEVEEKFCEEPCKKAVEENNNAKVDTSIEEAEIKSVRMGMDKEEELVESKQDAKEGNNIVEERPDAESSDEKNETEEGKVVAGPMSQKETMKLKVALELMNQMKEKEWKSVVFEHLRAIHREEWDPDSPLGEIIGQMERATHVAFVRKYAYGVFKRFQFL